GNFEADTISLTAVGTLPFTDSFSGYAKAGFHNWDADLRTGGIGRASDDGTDPTYGLGLQYRFTDTVALRGEYSRFEMDDVDVDLAQVQVRFDFSRIHARLAGTGPPQSAPASFPRGRRRLPKE